MGGNGQGVDGKRDKNGREYPTPVGNSGRFQPKLETGGQAEGNRGDGRTGGCRTKQPLCKYIYVHIDKCVQQPFAPVQQFSGRKFLPSAARCTAAFASEASKRGAEMDLRKREIAAVGGRVLN